VQINRELTDLTQVFVYAGKVCSGQICDQCLDAALQIVGSPSEEERLFAQQVTINDIANMKNRANSLLKRKEIHLKELNKAFSRLETAVPQLYASHRTLIIIGRAAIIGVVSILFGIFLFRR
jgi:hypothetical protein